MTAEAGTRDPLAVVAAVHPLASGAAQFNTAMVTALCELGPVHTLSWRRLYPPLIHGRDTLDRISHRPRLPHADMMLDWIDPRTWRAALRRIAATGSRAIVLPWVHPVMAPPYLYLLRHAPPEIARVVICHNVEQHEPVPFERCVSRSVLRHADLLVVHASHQAAELAGLGVTGGRVLGAFHPRFAAADLCELPRREQVEAERGRQGHPGLSLLAFGAIRPYKGIDLGLEALARVPSRLRARLTVAGVFWDGAAQLRRRISELGLEDRVELRDGFQSNEQAALLFSAADASLLPYRSASQSGVVQLSFAYGVPVVATSVGGLAEAVTDGVDGILCPPGDVGELTAAIQRMATDRAALAAGVRRGGEQHSFRRYGELLHEAIDALSVKARSRRPRTRRRAPSKTAEAPA